MRLPPGGDVKAYVSQAESAVAAMWNATNGKFQVLEDGIWTATPFACEPDRWYNDEAYVLVRRALVDAGLFP